MRQSLRFGAVIFSFVLAACAVGLLWLLALPPDLRARIVPFTATRPLEKAGSEPGEKLPEPPKAGLGPSTKVRPQQGDDASREAARPADTGMSRETARPPHEAIAPAPPDVAAPPVRKTEGSKALPATVNGRTGSEPGSREAPAPSIVPSFDVVRIEPSGESVIAGRAAPGATVEMLRGGEPFARALADPSGLFAIIPPLLPQGESELVLRAIGPDGMRLQSRENVRVTLGGRDARPLVTMTSPDRPTVVLSSPEPMRSAAGAAGPSPSAAAPPARAPVRIVGVEAQEGGSVVVSGQAAPDASVRLFLNETLIAPGSAGANGQFSFAIGSGMRPGRYKLRLEDVDPVSGEVKTRAEIAFTIPGPDRTAAAQPSPPKPDTRPLGAGPALPTGDEQGAPKAPSSTPDQPTGSAQQGTSPLPGTEPGTAKDRSTGTSPTMSVGPATPQGAEGERADRQLAPPPGLANPQADRPTGVAGPEVPPPSIVGPVPPPAPVTPSPDPGGVSSREASERSVAPTLPGGQAPGQLSSASPEKPSLSQLSNPRPAEPSSGAGGLKTRTEPSAPTETGATKPADPPRSALHFRSRRGSRARAVRGGTAQVSLGDTLWRISRQAYGRGVRYWVIVRANKRRIRDPDLIYPGQVFVLPQD